MKIPGLYERKGVYWFRKSTNGRRIAISLGTRDFAEAVRLAIEHKDGIEKEGDKTILSSAISTFLRTRAIRIRKRTAMNYTTALNKLLPEGRRAVKSVSAQWLEEQIRGLELKHDYTPVSINSYITVWRVFFSWCVKEKLIRQSPARELELRDGGSRIRDNKACSKEQRDTIIAAADNDDLRFILYAGFHAGMRKLEIIEARRDWFDLGAKMIHIKRAEGKRLRPGEREFKIKDSTERKLPMSDAFHIFLTQYLSNREPLDFALRPGVKHGKAEYRTNFAGMFNTHVMKCGMAWVTPHCMRHTFTTLLIQSGRPIDVVSFWLGDTPDVTRRHYSHLINYDSGINI